MRKPAASILVVLIPPFANMTLLYLSPPLRLTLRPSCMLPSYGFFSPRVQIANLSRNSPDGLTFKIKSKLWYTNTIFKGPVSQHHTTIRSGISLLLAANTLKFVHDWRAFVPPLAVHTGKCSVSREYFNISIVGFCGVVIRCGQCDFYASSP